MINNAAGVPRAPAALCQQWIVTQLDTQRRKEAIPIDRKRPVTWWAILGLNQ